MKFKVYDKNPVNINIGYKHTGLMSDPNHLLSNVEYNIRYVTPTRIIVDSDKPFYYAIDEYNNAWRTVDITYITNTKVSVTLVSQTLDCLKNPAGDYKITGDINLGIKGTAFNSIYCNPASWLSDKTTSVINTAKPLWDDEIEFTDYCIFQTAQPLFKNLGTELAKDWWAVTPVPTNFNVPAFMDYSEFTSDAIGTLGLYTYYVDTRKYGAEWTDITKFLGALIQSRTDFVNARLVRLPVNYFNDGVTADFEVGIKSGMEVLSLFTVHQVWLYKPKLYVVDVLDTTTILYGEKYWKVGESIIYPNVDGDGEVKLSMGLVIGSGACFGIFFTGELSDSMRHPQSFVSMELGYNIAPNTVNPSIYYTNKQYQSLVNTAPYLQSMSQLATTLGSVLLMSKAPALAKLAITAGGTGIALGTVAKGNEVIEREKFNRATVNNANDVQDITNYLSNINQVLRIEREAVQLSEFNEILNTYTPHNFTETVSMTTARLIKCACIAGEKNIALYKEGCVVGDSNTLLELLQVAGL